MNILNHSKVLTTMVEEAKTAKEAKEVVEILQMFLQVRKENPTPLVTAS